jgi:glutamine amidotransferase
MIVGIVDYNMGNIQSVLNAFRFLNQEAVVVRRPDELTNVDKIVLPGVGAFGQGMDNLKAQGLIPALSHEVLERKKVFLGICLGMQLICEESFEFGHFKGLGWIPASVKRFEPELKVRVPHIGWNTLNIRCHSALLAGDIDQKDVYFVHSYYLGCADKDYVAATSFYGREFASVIAKDNIYATQFHPEKSQQTGLAILKNFINLPSICLKDA